MTGLVSCDFLGVLQRRQVKSAHHSAFPQIVLDGELVGGLDIFREMIESGEWDEMWGGNPP